MSYVYIYYDPSRDNEPIYVGKGNGGRDRSHLRRKDHHPLTYRLRVMKRTSIEPVITRICDSVDDELAMLVEEEIIAKYGRKDLGNGPLLNLTNGGDGASGKIVSNETKALMSQVRTGEKRSAETCANISKAKKGQRYSDVARANISRGHIGMTYTAERNAKVSAGLMGHPVSAETRRKISDKAKARPPEKNGMFGRTQSAEARAKIGAAIRASAARKLSLKGI